MLQKGPRRKGCAASMASGQKPRVLAVLLIYEPITVSGFATTCKACHDPIYAGCLLACFELEKTACIVTLNALRRILSMWHRQL